MSNSEKIIGIWEGNYRYLHNKYNTKIGNFTMEILESNSNEFIGIISDDTEGRQSSIKGNFEDSIITFTKTYYSVELTDENSNKKRIEHKNYVKYEGQLTSEKEFYGTWFSKPQKIKYQGKEYEIKAEQGSWSAKKQ